MSFFTTDHGQAGNKFDPIKPGKYEVVVTKTEVAPAKTSGNMQIKVTYTVRSDVDQEFQKRKIFDNYTATEAAMFKFQQAAKAMGLPSGQAIPSIEWFAEQLMYKAFRLTVGNKREEWQGEMRTKETVNFIDAPKVPYSGGAEGSQTNPFEVPGGMTTDYGDFPPPSDDDEDFTPPWEREEELQTAEEEPTTLETIKTSKRVRKSKKDEALTPEELGEDLPY